MTQNYIFSAYYHLIVVDDCPFCEEALTLLNDAGDTLNRVIFGRSKSNYNRNYVRIGNNPNVYQTNTNVIYQLQTRPTYWGQKPKPPEPEEKVDTTSVE